MTYNRTLHGRFASGLYTPVIQTVLSLLLMLSAYWLPASVLPISLPSVPAFLVGLPSRLLSVLLYIIAAQVFAQQTFFDRRVRWMGAFYMWLVAISVFANGNCTIAVTSLLFVISFVLLLACQYSANPVRLLFTTFFMLGVMAFITPFSLCLIPLFLLFSFLTNIFSLQGFLASLLGVATPFWLVLGTAYVFPEVSVLSDNLLSGIPSLLDVSFPDVTPLLILQVVLVLVLLLPAITRFIGSANPAKPLLRRRFSFIIIAVIYLLSLFCVMNSGRVLFYFWLLPPLAVMASYVLTGKETRVMNIYFILINLIMLAIATHGIWLRL